MWNTQKLPQDMFIEEICVDRLRILYVKQRIHFKLEPIWLTPNSHINLMIFNNRIISMMHVK